MCGGSCNSFHVIVLLLCAIENTDQNYLEEGEVNAGVPAVADSLQVTARISTSFLVLIGIFFPSVTGKSYVHM